jgi:hypothetical protein
VQRPGPTAPDGIATKFEAFRRGFSWLASFTFGRALDTASEFAVCDAAVR